MASACATSCAPKTNQPQGYASCVGLPILSHDPISVLQGYAASAGASSTDFTMCLTVAFLLTRRMIMYKVNPGDCGTTASAISNSGLLTDLQLSQLGLGAVKAASSVGVQLGGALSGIAGGVASAIPIIGSVLSTITSIFSAISQHHALAVANEQKILCAASAAYNQFATQVEQGLTLGSISLTQATQAMEQVASQLDQALSTIAKQGNASYGYRIALRALRQYNEKVVYPSLGSSILGDNGLLVAGAGAVGLHFAGVF